MKKRQITTIILAITAVCSSWAQETIQLKGRIIDSKTRKDLPGATVQLMTADSIVIEQQAPSHHWVRNGQEGYSADFSFTVPKQNATYILRASYLGYKTACVDYTIGDIKRREFSRDVPPIALREDSKVLQEVSVTASKVKFYNRGDTIVYNADAFVLAEGSMLDALVRQMPGVEIKSDGRIYHNGQFVESLLLNGKDFFKGDNSVMLDNLPSYTVKQVEVYDKYGKMSDFLGERRESDKRYVMDVKLKKEYNIGTLANIEGGYGTEERWLARLFAMRYTDHSRLAFYGNANNLNDRRKPGQDNNWTPEQMGQGESREQQAGIDYTINDRNGRFEVNGNVQVSHSDQDLTTDQDRVNFLSQGDTYEYLRSAARNKDFSLRTSHNIDLTRKKVYLHFEPSFSYSHYDHSGSSVSAAFSAMQHDMSRSLLDNLYSLDAQDTIRRVLINRYSKETLNKGYSLNGGLTAQSTIKFKSSSDYLNLTAGITGVSKKDDYFNRYAIRYGSDGLTSNAANQYFKNHPDRQLGYRAFATYHFRMSQTTDFSIGYGYEHQHHERNSSLYLLDTLSTSAIGVLPSVAEYESLIDRRNSYASTYDEGTHNIIPAMEWTKQYEKGKLYFMARIFFQPTRQRLDYERGDVDTTIVRNSVKWALPYWILNWTSKDYSFSSQLVLNVQSQTPDLVNMVNIIDDTDPLNIRLGNPNLHNQQTYELKGLIRKSNHQRQTTKSLRLEYSRTANALAMGYSYDAATGIRTYRADNVDGNWMTAATIGYETPLDKKRRLMLSTNTRAEYRNSVDLIGENTTGSNFAPVESAVHTTHLGEDLRLSYKVGSSSTVGVKGNFAWYNTNSDRTDFSRINAFNFNYGTIATLQLPWHFQLATDLTMFSRRGYEGSSMNTDNLIWNVRLSYTMLKGHLTWMLDGFDLLGQLDNVTRVVNAQGRIETYTNVLPRYTLLHVVYRFNKQPKKK